MVTLGKRTITILLTMAVCAGFGAAVGATAADAAPAICAGTCGPDPEDPGDPGTGGTGGGTGTAPGGGSTGTTNCTGQATGAKSYTPDCGTGHHLHAELYLLRWEQVGNGPGYSARVQAYSRFENARNDRVDASYLRVACHDTYGRSDSDHENGASKTTVSYNTGVTPPGGPVTVTCEHQATYRGVNYSTSTTATLYAPSYYG